MDNQQIKRIVVVKSSTANKQLINYPFLFTNPSLKLGLLKTSIQQPMPME